ncbi:hypothetical protein FSARC_10080 [Fusarium sarcochroum]|uniref:Apple domain-containing protein n=1 Tax=Fusarium sarcochroum TaxID=1208366 RepID=A0A8H4TQ04_9HYPO|nr:hypothetical protein FSARC_10080 [Fusarium sarcochroum]
MPSTTKTIAVAVAALAASGVEGTKCKPTEDTCTSYTLKDDAGPECGVAGKLKRGKVVGSLSLEDCAKDCIDSDYFKCELIGYAPIAGSDDIGICTLYSDTKFTPKPKGPVKYYDPGCFTCSRGGRGGRGGRGRGGRGGVYGGRIRRTED